MFQRNTRFLVRAVLLQSKLGQTRTAQGAQLVKALSTDTTNWKWVPPPARPKQTLEEEATDQTRESIAKEPIGKPIPAIKGVHLTADDVISAFALNGAENITQKPCGQMADAMIIATARSSMHAKMLAELVVKATKDRRLKTYNPSKPIEGEEDWFLVDTGKLFVHVFGDEKTRREVGLEQHLDDLAERSKKLKAQSNQNIEESERTEKDDEEIQISSRFLKQSPVPKGLEAGDKEEDMQASVQVLTTETLTVRVESLKEDTEKDLRVDGEAAEPASPRRGRRRGFRL